MNGEGRFHSNNVKAVKDGEGFLYLILVEESRRHQKFLIYEGIIKETWLDKISVKLGRLLRKESSFKVSGGAAPD